ncbi:MAG: hypothetical protein K5931_07270 [Lachnospiraceae bacterium]|nr:hypothetical protein [Lachnospiraceae bacterium]
MFMKAFNNILRMNLSIFLIAAIFCSSFWLSLKSLNQEEVFAGDFAVAPSVVTSNNVSTSAATSSSATSSSQSTSSQSSTSSTASSGGSHISTETGATTSGSSEGSTNSSGVYSSSEYIKPGNYWATPICNHGQPVIIALPIVNMTPYNITNVVVTPMISNKSDTWPFEINASNYTISFDTLLGSRVQPDINERTKYLYWTFMTRDDILNGYYPIKFEVLYMDEVCNQGSAVLSTYVQCVGKPDAGNINTDESLATSTPRIIVTGFETNPANVYAGSEFDLMIHLKNTSQETEVSNLEVDLTATVEGKDQNSSYSAFLPTSGSNTAYFSSIPIGGTADIKMRFTAKADLAQKPYVMKLAMKYEDKKNNPYTGEASVSVPIMQDSRFEISSIEMTPSNINVGGQANAMFNVYNTGKTTLYNVKIQFNGDNISGGDAFIGNLESGATGSVDTMITGDAPSEGEGELSVTVSYENESGQVFSQDFPANLYINPELIDEELDLAMEGVIAPQGGENSKIPLWAKIAIPIAGGIVIIGVIGAVIAKKKKKKKAEADLEDFD